VIHVLTLALYKLFVCVFTSLPSSLFSLFTFFFPYAFFFTYLLPDLPIYSFQNRPGLLPFLKRAFKYGFCNTVYTIGANAEEADKVLFKKAMSANHCIHFLLPGIKSSVYSLRAKGHSYQLPRCECELHKKSFIPRCLYRHCNC